MLMIANAPYVISQCQRQTCQFYKVGLTQACQIFHSCPAADAQKPGNSYRLGGIPEKAQGAPGTPSFCVGHEPQKQHGGVSKPITINFSGMNIYLQAILRFTRGTSF